MPKASYAHVHDRCYPSPRHETEALDVARGFVPPPEDRSWLQQAALDAWHDGSTEPHSYWKVKLVDLGHGHKEGTVVKITVDPWKKLTRKYFEGEVARGDGDRDASVERGQRRAKQQVRWRVKALGCNSLGTLTYRANVQDRDLVLKHWKEFMRRVKRVLPAFPYVAVLEKQKRGALHIHIAMRRLPARLWVTYEGKRQLVKSWDFMRNVWRRVVGKLGGNFDESKKLGRGDRARAMRIATYIGGYVGKDFADCALNRKRYWASGTAAPQVTVRQVDCDASMADLIASVYAHVGEVIDLQTHFQRNRELFWLSAHERPRFDLSAHCRECD